MTILPDGNPYRVEEDEEVEGVEDGCSDDNSGWRRKALYFNNPGQQPGGHDNHPIIHP